MSKLPLNIQSAINEFVIECKKKLGSRLKRVILYGSYARGDYNNSSDIDILVLTDYEPEEFYAVLKKISNITYDIELKYDVILTPLINNLYNFNNSLESIPFYTNIQKEGVILSE